MSSQLIKEGLTVLKEVFNRPYPIQREPRGYADIYTASTEDGREIYINIELRDADDVSLKAFDSFNPMIAKDFGWNPNHVIGKIDFSVDDSTEVTGRGDAPRILATVVEAIRLSMSTNRNLVGFMFWGFGLSRSRLYRTMVRRLGRQYNMDVVKSKNVPKVDGEFLLLADAKRARYMFTKEVFEDNSSNTIREDYKVDYGGATPFNNAFRRYMSGFYPPGQDNKGRRMQDVRNALLGHRLGLIGTEDINKLQQTYNQRERKAGGQQDRDQYLNPEYQKRMRNIYTGKVSPGELGTVPGGEGTLANKKYNDALQRRNRIQSLARKMYGDFTSSKSPSKPGIQEDIGPKTSKQSIRPYMKNAVRGLRR